MRSSGWDKSEIESHFFWLPEVASISLEGKLSSERVAIRSCFPQEGGDFANEVAMGDHKELLIHDLQGAGSASLAWVGIDFFSGWWNVLYDGFRVDWPHMRRSSEFGGSVDIEFACGNVPHACDKHRGAIWRSKNCSS